MILASAADLDVIVPVVPIGRQTALNALRTLCYHIKEAVGACFHNLPSIAAPLISVLVEKVRREARHKRAAARVLILPLKLTCAVNSKRHIKRFCFCNNARILAVLRIAAVNIAVVAAGGDLRAAVPRVSRYCNGSGRL